MEYPSPFPPNTWSTKLTLFMIIFVKVSDFHDRRTIHSDVLIGNSWNERSIMSHFLEDNPSTWIQTAAEAEAVAICEVTK